MIPVFKRGHRRRLPRLHLRYFGIIKPVRFQIGEAPIRIAAIRPDLISPAIGGNCLILAPNSFQRMAISQIYTWIIGHRPEQRLINQHRFIKIADGKIFICVQHFKLRITRLFSAQFRRFAQR